MASAKPLEENDNLGKLGEYFLTCSLCQEYYKNAKTLQCLHSYCEGCLQTLVQKSAETLRCPECRCEFQLPVDGTSALASNFLINGEKYHDAEKKQIECDIDHYEIAEKNIASVCDFINVLINYGDWEAAAQFKQATVRVNEVMKIRTRYYPPKIPAIFRPNNEMMNGEGVIGILEEAIKVTRSKIPKYAITKEVIQIDVQYTDFHDYTTDRLQATLTDPDGKVKQLDVSRGSNCYRVKFREDAEGLYDLSLTVDGYSMPGSPFTIHVMSGENMAAQMKVGTVVIRGRDWSYGSEDGNPPGTGEITAERQYSGLITVKWSSTGICRQYFMKEGIYRCKLAGFY
ncbi:uncharacterized protein [Ptychodera flava]|uniref:uncharacterized protein n=1 Tax=Ptychodera flava TaxID=63121 RepID=UPI00396A96E9